MTGHHSVEDVTDIARKNNWHFHSPWAPAYNLRGEVSRGWRRNAPSRTGERRRRSPSAAFAIGWLHTRRCEPGWSLHNRQAATNPQKHPCFADEIA